MRKLPFNLPAWPGFAALGLAAIVTLSLSTARPALAQERCPDNPATTYSFFQGSTDYDAEKPRVEALADAAKQTGAVCIVSLFGTTYDKLFAIRRATWARDTLIAKGVSSGTIAIELRQAATAPEKSGDPKVIIVLGK